MTLQNSNMNTLSYSQFLDIVGKDKIFIKFLREDLTHCNFKYQIGLNIDTNEFNPNGYCSKGGLYFTDKKI